MSRRMKDLYPSIFTACSRGVASASGRSRPHEADEDRGPIIKRTDIKFSEAEAEVSDSTCVFV